MTRIGFLLAALLLAATTAQAKTGAPPAADQPVAEKNQTNTDHRDKAKKALKAIKGDEDKDKKGSASGDQKSGR